MLGDNALKIFIYLLSCIVEKLYGSDILIFKYLIFLHKILIFLWYLNISVCCILLPKRSWPVKDKSHTKLLLSWFGLKELEFH